MNKAIKRLAVLHITTKEYMDIDLIDASSDIIITPIIKRYTKSNFSVEYRNLWAGDFCILNNRTLKKINISTRKQGLFETEGLSYNIRLKITYVNESKWFRGIKDPLIRRMNRFGWNYCLQKFESLSAVCQYLSDVSQSQIGREAKVIPTPIEITDINQKSKGIKLLKPSALLIQNHQIKLKSEALISFASVIEALPRVNFYISEGLPENRTNRYYRNVKTKLGKLQNVHFVNINRTNKYDYLKSADMYLLVSGLDCTPATILEAGLASKPVLASAIGGVPEMIINGKTGWSIPNDRPEIWVEKIKILADDYVLAEKIGRQNHDMVIENYNLKSYAENLFSLFE